MSETKTAEFRLYNDIPNEYIFQTDGKVYVDSDYHNKQIGILKQDIDYITTTRGDIIGEYKQQNQELQNSIKFKDDYIESLQDSYYIMEARCKELQRQVEELTMQRNNTAIEWDKFKSQYTQIKESADEMAIELIDEILHNCIDRESVEMLEFIKCRANTSAYMAISKKDDNLISLVQKNTKHNTIKTELIKLRNSIYSADPTGHEIVIKDLSKQCDYILKKLDIPYKHLTNKP